jgi:hypothetical protein
VLAFEGYGVKLALSPPQPEQPMPREVTLTLERDEEDRDGSAVTDLYSNPALWGPRGRPDFE